MKKLLLIIILSIPATSFAGWTAGYTILTDDDDGESITIGAINGSYKWNIDGSDFSTEAGMLLGVQDDKISGVTLGLDTSIYLKGMYNINEDFFIAATFGNYGLNASIGGVSVSASETDVGIGIGFNVGQITFSLDVFESTNLFSGQYNF